MWLYHLGRVAIDKLPKDRGYFPGSPPFIITEQQDLFRLLMGSDEEKSQIEFGAHQVIIVRNQEAKKMLPRELNLAIVLTVFEAKGLEFDDVFVYDFFKDSPATAEEWRATCWYTQQERGLSTGETSTGEDYARKVLGCSPRPLRDGEFEKNRSTFGRINEELKQLYTAFTRARVSLFLYDSDTTKNLPLFYSLLSKRLVKKLDMQDVEMQLAGEMLDLDNDERAQVARIRAKSSTKAEWKKAGQRLEEKGLYDAAINCYARSGDFTLMHRARGNHLITRVIPEALEGSDEQMELIFQAGYELLQTGERDHLEDCYEVHSFSSRLCQTVLSHLIHSSRNSWSCTH